LQAQEEAKKLVDAHKGEIAELVKAWKQAKAKVDEIEAEIRTGESGRPMFDATAAKGTGQVHGPPADEIRPGPRGESDFFGHRAPKSRAKAKLDRVVEAKVEPTTEPARVGDWQDDIIDMLELPDFLRAFMLTELDQRFHLTIGDIAIALDAGVPWVDIFAGSDNARTFGDALRFAMRKYAISKGWDASVTYPNGVPITWFETPIDPIELASPIFATTETSPAGGGKPKPSKRKAVAK
jgi:hypothetical protein